MAHFWQQFRSGTWVTLARIRGYSLILLIFYAIAIVGWLALSHGLTDPNGKPIGTDFSSFYAAGSLVLEGHAAGAYDMATHYAREQQIFGSATPYYAWFYPPLFLFLAAPLALIPYALALVVWQVVTLGFFAGVAAAILHRPPMAPVYRTLCLVAALAFPAVFVNLEHGQNGFLTAALLGAAALALPQRPTLSGLLFGLLAYKPQFALVIPVALIAASQWRAVGAAAATVVILVIASTLIFGLDIWTVFAASTEMSRKLLLQDGAVGFAKLQSVFAAVRMWDGAVTLAYVLQCVTTGVVIFGVAWVWRSSRDDNAKSALLMIATLLASPHVLDYDLTILGPAIAFMVTAGLTTGFRKFEISLLVAAWSVPLLTRGIAVATGIPLGLMVIIACYAVVLQRNLENRDNVNRRNAELAAV